MSEAYLGSTSDVATLSTSVRQWVNQIDAEDRLDIIEILGGVDRPPDDDAVMVRERGGGDPTELDRIFFK